MSERHREREYDRKHIRHKRKPLQSNCTTHKITVWLKMVRIHSFLHNSHALSRLPEVVNKRYVFGQMGGSNGHGGVVHKIIPGEVYLELSIRLSFPFQADGKNRSDHSLPVVFSCLVIWKALRFSDANHAVRHQCL